MPITSKSFQKQIVEIEGRTPFVNASQLLKSGLAAPNSESTEDVPPAVPSPKPNTDNTKSKRPIQNTVDGTAASDLPETEREPVKSENVTSKTIEVTVPDYILRNVQYKSDNLKNTPKQERPRERMRELGPAGITSTELLAIILRSGTEGKNVKNVADELLTTFDGLRGLSRVTPFNMAKVDGIGDVKADVLTAAFELGRRAAQEDLEHNANDYGAHMRNGEAIAWTVAKHFTTRLRHNMQEEMWIAFLDVRNRFRGKTRIYIGCCDQLVAKTGEILSRVVERNFPRYALVHNHPSGKGDPSGADISFTERLVKAGALLDIELVDHVVLGEDMSSCVSMRQRRLVDFTPRSRARLKLREVNGIVPNHSA